MITGANDEETMMLWQDVLDAIASGRPDTASCPFCQHHPLTIANQADGSTRISCSKCQQYLVGAFRG